MTPFWGVWYKGKQQWNSDLVVVTGEFLIFMGDINNLFLICLIS